MKPCRNQNMPPHRPPVSGQSGGQSAPTPMAAAPVHRYAHPIRTARPTQRSSTEETLSLHIGDPFPTVGPAGRTAAPDGAGSALTGQGADF